jgi:hypothetical protein
LNAFSGVDVLKRSNKLSLDCIDLLTIEVTGGDVPGRPGSLLNETRHCPPVRVERLVGNHPHNFFFTKSTWSATYC